MIQTESNKTKITVTTEKTEHVTEDVTTETINLSAEVSIKEPTSTENNMATENTTTDLNTSESTSKNKWVLGGQWCDDIFKTSGCVRRKNQGKCETKKTFMQKKCKRTCGFC